MIGDHRIVIADHHQENRQRQIGVVQRALLARGAKSLVRNFAAQQGFRGLALVRNDHHENIGRHDRADEGAHMNQRAPPGKHMGMKP